MIPFPTLNLAWVRLKTLLSPLMGRSCSWIRCWRCLMLSGTFLLLSVTLAQAQGATPPPPNVVTSGRSLILEWVIVGVMIALALFAVCRSSRRN